MSSHALNFILCIKTGWARYGRERRERHGWTPRIKGNIIYTSIISTHLSLVISISISFKHVTCLLSERLIPMCHNHTGRQRRNGRTRTTRTHGISISQSVNPLNRCYESSFICSANVVAECLTQFPRSLPQGYPGEKGMAGSSDIIDFNGKLLDAFQVNKVRQRNHVFHQAFITES